MKFIMKIYRVRRDQCSVCTGLSITPSYTLPSRRDKDPELATVLLAPGPDRSKGKGVYTKLPVYFYLLSLTRTPNTEGL